jgi:hypothetical protein
VAGIIKLAKSRGPTILMPAQWGWEGVMPKSQHWIEFLYVSLVGWIWIATSLAAVCFLVRAVFFGGGWWPAIASVAAAWFLYKVTLYYQLERTAGQLPNK